MFRRRNWLCFPRKRTNSRHSGLCCHNVSIVDFVLNKDGKISEIQDTSKKRKWASRIIPSFIGTASYSVKLISHHVSVTINIRHACTSRRAACADIGRGVARDLVCQGPSGVTRLQLGKTE